MLPEPPAKETQPVQGTLGPSGSSSFQGKFSGALGARFSTEEEKGHVRISRCPTNIRPEQKGFKMATMRMTFSPHQNSHIR